MDIRSVSDQQMLSVAASSSTGSLPQGPSSLSPPLPDSDSDRAALALSKYGDRHAFKIKTQRFVVDKRYVPIRALGQGAYGVVCSASDRESGEKVAIKKVTHCFDDVIDAKRILREIKLLRHLRHENVVGIRDMVNPFSKKEFEDVYLVMDLMDSDMHRIIHSKNQLTDEHYQIFMYQLLCGLLYMHSARVIHRDLKPSNLLISSSCQLKICDFGLARGVNAYPESADEDNLTEYVVTRWYRAPEIMVCCQDYDASIDVWSAGCIFAELMGKKPLFPGDNYIHQLDLIFGAMGTPANEDLEWMTNEKACEYIKSLPRKEKIPLRKIFPASKATDDAIDLLEKMLIFNPNKRITVQEALEHRYFAAVRNRAKERVCESKFDFGFEKALKTKGELQEEMFREICKFRPEAEYVNPLSSRRMNDYNANVDLMHDEQV